MYQNRYSLLSIQLEYILSAGIQGCGGWWWLVRSTVTHFYSVQHKTSSKFSFLKLQETARQTAACRRAGWKSTVQTCDVRAQSARASGEHGHSADLQCSQHAAGSVNHR